MINLERTRKISIHGTSHARVMDRKKFKKNSSKMFLKILKQNTYKNEKPENEKFYNKKLNQK